MSVDLCRVIFLIVGNPGRYKAEMRKLNDAKPWF